jgi:hypothetical protein
MTGEEKERKIEKETKTKNITKWNGQNGVKTRSLWYLVSEE